MSFFTTLFSSSGPVEYDGVTDWHSHILPGVDDGVADMATSLAVLARYEQMGIRQVWLTPHIMEDVPNTTALLKDRHEDLLAAYRGKIVIRLASENMIDSLFYERLRAGDLLPIGHRHDSLLVETTFFNAPMDFENTLREIRHKGFFPLLAHPERYAYLQSMADYRRLKELGVRFQLNLLSLAGAYGDVPRRKAMKILKAGMYDRFGTDLHRLGQVDALTKLTLPQSALMALDSIKGTMLT